MYAEVLTTRRPLADTMGEQAVPDFTYTCGLQLDYDSRRACPGPRLRSGRVERLALSERSESKGEVAERLKAAVC